jgi:hypothetical protein
MMSRSISELKNNEKTLSPELLSFLKELNIGSNNNIKDIQLQIENANKELEYRRSLGENI